MIKMQMRIYYDADIFRRHSGNYLQRFRQSTLAINAVHLCVLRRPLIADTAFDQYPLAAGIDEQAIHVHAYAVLIIGWADPGP
jgi:hypothetical protein